MTKFDCVVCILVISSCSPKKQLWENCQFDPCDEELYCFYGQDLNKKHYFHCTQFCQSDEDCPPGPDDAVVQCKLFFRTDGICMIPCSYDFKDYCPENFTCINTTGLKKKYCW
jgi:hypothetical protein